MGYRKIHVDGKPYSYVIGRTHVKVVGVGVVPKEIISDEIDVSVVVVRPKHVADWISGKTLDRSVPHQCANARRHLGPYTGSDVSFRAWPFHAEIYGKAYFAWICDDCFRESSEEI